MNCNAADIDVGGTYSVLLTTAGGLYRYQTGDSVRVTGRCGQTPCLEFLGKLDHISDRFGEKLKSFFVVEVLAELQRLAAITFEFGMMVPDGPGYTLFVQAKAKLSSTLATMLDELLARNPHYAIAAKNVSNNEPVHW